MENGANVGDKERHLCLTQHKLRFLLYLGNLVERNEDAERVVGHVDRPRLVARTVAHALGALPVPLDGERVAPRRDGAQERKVPRLGRWAQRSASRAALQNLVVLGQAAQGRHCCANICSAPGDECVDVSGRAHCENVAQTHLDRGKREGHEPKGGREGAQSFHVFFRVSRICLLKSRLGAVDG